MKTGGSSHPGLPDPGSRVTVVETSGFSMAQNAAMVAGNKETVWEQAPSYKANRDTDALISRDRIRRATTERGRDEGGRGGGVRRGRREEEDGGEEKLEMLRGKGKGGNKREKEKEREE